METTNPNISFLLESQIKSQEILNTGTILPKIGVRVIFLFILWKLPRSPRPPPLPLPPLPAAAKSLAVFVPLKLIGSLGVALPLTLHPYSSRNPDRRSRALFFFFFTDHTAFSHISKSKNSTQKDVCLS